MRKLNSIFASILVLLSLGRCWADNDESSSSLKVLLSPSYFKFDSSKKLPLNHADDVILAINSFAVDPEIKWDGIKKVESKSFPQATVVFLVEEPIEIESKATFKITGKTGKFDLENLYKSTSKSNTLVKDFDHLPTDEELKNIRYDCSQSSSVIYVIQTESSTPELAKRINSTIEKLNEKCESSKGNLLAFLLTTSDVHRSKRQAQDDKKIANPAEFYRDQYPAIFNILFWLSLVLAIVVYAIAYNMWYMDPGLDTVIYRMTSQRIKKDQ